ncbi:MAG: glycosyltransferase, partial [Bacteroidota bacterium]
RNELENLQQNLDRFLSQSYRSFEVVVVNDHSTDGTLEYLLDNQKKYSNLVIVNLKEATPPGKKAALTEGIWHATHDLLLLTDADCSPRSKNWISQMQAALIDRKQIVLGYSPYLPAPTPLNYFICFETVFTAVQYFSFALIRIPYMGVGRNLLYHRSIFERAGGFRQHAHLASGDDDLLINAVADQQNTSIILDPQTFIDSIPKRTWSGYYYQKTRHLTTGSSYKRVHQLVLGLVSASHFGHYVLGLCLINSPLLLVVLLIYLVRMSVVWFLYARILRKLHALRLLPWIPLLDAALVLYYALFAPVLITGKQQQWK